MIALYQVCIVQINANLEALISATPSSSTVPVKLPIKGDKLGV